LLSIVPLSRKNGQCRSTVTHYSKYLNLSGPYFPKLVSFLAVPDTPCYVGWAPLTFSFSGQLLLVITNGQSPDELFKPPPYEFVVSFICPSPEIGALTVAPPGMFDKHLLFNEKSIREEKYIVKEKNRAKGKETKEDI